MNFTETSALCDMEDNISFDEDLHRVRQVIFVTLSNVEITCLSLREKR